MFVIVRVGVGGAMHITGPVAFLSALDELMRSLGQGRWKGATEKVDAHLVYTLLSQEPPPLADQAAGFIPPAETPALAPPLSMVVEAMGALGASPTAASPSPCEDAMAYVFGLPLPAAAPRPVPQPAATAEAARRSMDSQANDGEPPLVRCSPVCPRPAVPADVPMIHIEPVAPVARGEPHPRRIPPTTALPPMDERVCAEPTPDSLSPKSRRRLREASPYSAQSKRPFSQSM